MNLEMAHQFLTRCFAPGETIAVLLRREEPRKVMQRIVMLEKACRANYLRWLAHENSTGVNVYVAANPLHIGSRRRIKESIAEIRHVYLDLDANGSAIVHELCASDRVPTPNVILATSPDKYQVLWRVQGFTFEQQEATLKQLALAFHGDPACTDCNRVLRMPGFLNRKYDPPCLVTAVYRSEYVAVPTDFRLELTEQVSNPSRDGVSLSRRQAGKQSDSEDDWAWVCRELMAGEDAGLLTLKLASRRRDKSNPTYYAQRTVDVASARLWLIEGIRIDDVITMLEHRRSFELPSSRCSARAREIARTAERMIARRRTA